MRSEDILHTTDAQVVRWLRHSRHELSLEGGCLARAFGVTERLGGRLP